MVLVDQPSEHLFAVDPRYGVDDVIRALVGWHLPPALVWAMLVVVRLELGQDSAQVSVSRDEQVVQAFAAHGADEPLCVGVIPRRQVHLIAMIGVGLFG